jgi:hypothetical protein
MAKKIKKFWMPTCQSEDVKQKGEFYLKNIVKLNIQVLGEVLQRGVLDKINQHTKNYAIVQNTLAGTLKSYIMMIIGSLEMSKDVLRKSINFIVLDEDSLLEGQDGLYSPRNYSTNLICKLYKRGINIEQGIRVFEDRFLAESDKDFLLLVVDSMQKGQHVQIKKVRAQHDNMQRQKESEKPSAPTASLSAQDKQNIIKLHDMFSARSK